MADTVLRARSATELVDTSFQLLRRHYVPLVTVSGIGMAPWLVAEPFIRRALGPVGFDPTAASSTPLGSASAIGLFAPLLIFLFTMIWYSLAGAAIITAAAQGYLEGRVDVGAAIQRVVSRAGSVIYASIAKGVYIGLGALMLLVGAFYFYATYFAVPTTVMMENLTGEKGLARSRTLAKGRRGHVLKTMLLTFVIYMILGLATGALAGLLVGTSNPTLTNILTTLFTILIYPIVPVTEMLLYYDLRIRAEGYDVEVLAAQLDAAGGASPAGAAGTP